MTKKYAVLFLLVIALPLVLGACRAQETRTSKRDMLNDSAPGSLALAGSEVVDLRKTEGLESILPDLASSRVVYVGETHDRYSHHVTQLEVIRLLHSRNPDMAIGMEFFQQPFQRVLDDYVAGVLSEQEMLAQTEWFDRWRYDYRHYQPIMRYAREHRIPVLALNVPAELTGRVSEAGLEGLTGEERSRLPAVFDFSDEAYRARLKAVFERHPHAREGDFGRFVEVQLAWDEGMADTLSRHLQQHPDRKVVVLAGSGHLMFGSGIPQRVQRRIPVSSYIVLPGEDLAVQPGIADFVVYGEPLELPAAGMMGVLMGAHDDGVVVSEVVTDSAAHQAGLKKGDVIQSLDGMPVVTTSDVRIGMLGKLPGDKVRIQVLRRSLLSKARTQNFDLVLQQ